jgi:hypothetical protein
MGALRNRIPESCANLSHAKVIKALHKHVGAIYPAARELGVPGPDLRRLTWAKPDLLEKAMEEHEFALACAISVVIEALFSDDPRRQMWASDKILSSSLGARSPFAPARRGGAGPSPEIAVHWRE